jgi:hypothetical protein
MVYEEEIPFCVFIDTESLRSAHFNWRSPVFQSLRERVARGSIEIITTDVVINEARKGIAKLLEDFTQQIAKARRQGTIASAIADSRIDSLADLDSNKIPIDSLFAAFESFLRELNARKLEPPPQALKEILALYFSNAPPFDKREKKSEFPDAVNMCTLMHFADTEERQICIVSADGDWKRICDEHPQLKLYTHLSEIIDRAIREEWLTPDVWSEDELLGYIRANTDTLKLLMERELRRSSRVNKGDGQIDELTIDTLFFDSIAITSATSQGKSVAIGAELFHTVFYYAAGTIDDDEFSNVIEGDFADSIELVAQVMIKVPLDNPRNIQFLSVDYVDGLDLNIPLKY